eukprot:5601345-Pyramimonas_sp.AAC.1
MGGGGARLARNPTSQGGVAARAKPRHRHAGTNWKIVSTYGPNITLTHQAPDCRPAMWQSVGRKYTTNIRIYDEYSVEYAKCRAPNGMLVSTVDEKVEC